MTKQPRTRNLGALRRYRFMFRVSLGAVAAGLLLLALGVWTAVRSGPPPTLLLVSIVMFELAVITCYKVAVSTMHILDPRRCDRPGSGEHAETRS